MTQNTWLEVALNGGGGHAHQHLMPITSAQLIEEGIACANAGASIIHFHAYDPKTERQRDTVELYAEVIEGIRSKVDANHIRYIANDWFRRSTNDQSCEGTSCSG